MKLAEDWVRDLNYNIHSDPDDRDAEDARKVRRIQADALREAARLVCQCPTTAGKVAVIENLANEIEGSSTK